MANVTREDRGRALNCGVLMLPLIQGTAVERDMCRDERAAWVDHGTVPPGSTEYGELAALAQAFAQHRHQAVERERAWCAKVTQVSEALCGEFERAVAHADWVAAGSKGMHVPFHGDFANVRGSALSRIRWWARELRKALGPAPEVR